MGGVTERGRSPSTATRRNTDHTHNERTTLARLPYPLADWRPTLPTQLPRYPRSRYSLEHVEPRPPTLDHVISCSAVAPPSVQSACCQYCTLASAVGCSITSPHSYLVDDRHIVDSDNYYTQTQKYSDWAIQ